MVNEEGFEARLQAELGQLKAEREVMRKRTPQMAAQQPAAPTGVEVMKRNAAGVRAQQAQLVGNLDDASLLVKFVRLRDVVIDHLAEQTAHAVLTDDMAELEEVVTQSWRDHPWSLELVLDEIDKREIDIGSYEEGATKLRTSLEHKYLAEGLLAVGLR